MKKVKNLTDLQWDEKQKNEIVLKNKMLILNNKYLQRYDKWAISYTVEETIQPWCTWILFNMEYSKILGS